MKIDNVQSNTNFNGIFQIVDKKVGMMSPKKAEVLGTIETMLKKDRLGYMHENGIPYIFSPDKATDKIIRRYLLKNKIEANYSTRQDFFATVMDADKLVINDREMQRVIGLEFSKLA